MLDTAIDVQAIIASNPRTSRESLQRTESLVHRMCCLGIEKTGYRLASPFSSSLKRIRKDRLGKNGVQSK